MKIKRYEGQYVHEVVERIREELGPDAVVLHTRWRNPAGLKRLLGKPQVEVWAGARTELANGQPAPEPARPALQPVVTATHGALDVVDDPEPARPEPVLPSGQPNAARAEALANGLSQLLNGAAAASPAPPVPDLAAAADDLTVALLAEFNESLGRIEAKVDALATAPEPTADPVDAGPRLKALLRSGVDAEIAQEVVTAAEGRTVAEVLLDNFQASGPLELGESPKVVALIGPSGVGKTTTVAKLAGHYAVEHGARVLLASTDTHRIGTFEQIKALGQLMELPTCALRTPQEAQARMQMARQAHDLILVDTAACAPRPGADWDDLLDLLIAIEPDQIHLVLPAGMKSSEATGAVRFFQQGLPLHSAVVTKLDEASDAGLLVDLAWRCLTPFSYLGTGHEIPGDLEQATPERLLRQVWSTRSDSANEEPS